MKLQPKRRKVWVTVALMCLVVFCITSLFTTATAVEDSDKPSTEITQITVTVDGTEYDLSDHDSALEYVGAYDTNVNADPNFDKNLDTALGTVRKTIPFFSTIWALLPPIIAIVLALITKEVYSSLFVGILAGGLLYSNFSFEGTVNHVLSDGFVGSIADSYNVGILVFLVMLGTLFVIKLLTGKKANA